MATVAQRSLIGAAITRDGWRRKKNNRNARHYHIIRLLQICTVDGAAETERKGVARCAS